MNFKYHKDKDIKTNEEEKLPDIILINQDMMDSMVFCSLNMIYLSFTLFLAEDIICMLDKLLKTQKLGGSEMTTLYFRADD